MTPDTPTLFLAGTLIALVMSAIDFGAARRFRSPAIMTWAGGNLAFALGCLAFAVRGSAPPFLPSVAGNALLVLGFALVARGVDQLDRRRTSLAETLGGPLLAAALLAASVERGESHVERLAVMASTCAYYALRAAVALLLRRRLGGLRVPCAGFLLGFVALYLARATGVMGGFLAPDGAVTEAIGGAIRLAALVLMVAWSFCLLLLALDREASRDGLTGLLNRRAALAAGQAAIDRARGPSSLLMIDLDDFKTVNDRFGHPGGDRALQAFATVASRALRADDVVGRLGGEEFCVVLPGADAERAMRAAERLRTEGERYIGRLAGLPGPVTMSIGVVTASGPETDVAVLMRAADAALYAAKSVGRNASVRAPGRT